MPLFGRKKKKEVSKKKKADTSLVENLPSIFEKNGVELGTYGSLTYVKPKGWPTIPISLAQSKEAVDKDIKVLQLMIESNGVGEVLFHQEIDTIDDRFTLPIQVRTPEGPPVPIFLQYEPFSADHLDSILPVIHIRKCPEFRNSPFALYSRFPIPLDVAYHFSGVPEALFEGRCKTLVSEFGLDFPTLAVRCQEIALETFDVELDLSPESLVRVDDILYRLHWTEEPPALMTTAFVIGAYVGEVIRQNLGGEWVKDEYVDFPRIHKGESKVSPITKVMNQISMQDGDEVAFFYKGAEVIMGGSDHPEDDV